MSIRGGLWHRHPAVRSGTELTFGERAADQLKAAFGSWFFLIALNGFIIGWIALNVVLPHSARWDIYPFILLNLGLSWLAAQQGGALQIAANRGDRISSELALHTERNTEELMTINKTQLELLQELRKLQEQLRNSLSADATLARRIDRLDTVVGNLGAVLDSHRKQEGTA